MIRTLGGSEVLLLARTLLPRPVAMRPGVASQILNEVEAAAQYMRLFGRCHPEFGDGSVMSRCYQLSPCAEPFACDGDFLAAVVVACQALMRHSEP